MKTLALLSPFAFARHALPTFAVALLALSCSSSSSPSNNGPTDSGSGTDSTPTDGGGETAAECVPDPDNPPKPGSVCLRHVTGTLVDDKGAPLSIHDPTTAPDGLVVTVCGSVCYFAGPGPTAGSFDVHIGEIVPVSTYNIIVHGLADHASSYRPVPALDASGNVAVTEKIVAPVFDQIGTALPADGAGGTVAAGNVTLVVPAGAAFELDPDFVELKDAGRIFKSFAWKAADPPSFAAGSNVVELVALGPFASKSCKSPPCAAGDEIKMSVSLTNTTTSLTAGMAVEFLTLGFDLYAIPFVSGQMNVVAVGHVSADGKTIDTDTGEGISTISWLGVRQKH